MNASLAQPMLQQRAALSPDGRWFAGVVEEASQPHVVLIDLTTHELLRPFGELSAWSPSWSPDKPRLACLVASNGTTTLGLWARGAAPWLLEDLALQALQFGDDAPQWLPGGDRVLVHISVPEPKEPSEQRLVDVLENDPGRGVTPPFTQGGGFTPVIRHAVVSASTGDVEALALPPGIAVLSPDGRRVAVHSGVRETVGSEWCEVNVTVAWLGETELEPVLHRSLPATGNDGRHPTAWSPDGAQYALVMRDHVLVVSGETQLRLDAPAELWPAVALWTPDGTTLVVADAHRGLWALPLLGAPRKLDAHGEAPVRVEDDRLYAVVTGVTECRLRHVPLDGTSAQDVSDLVGRADVTRLGTIWGWLGGAGPACEPLVYASGGPTRPTTYRVRREGADVPVDLHPGYDDAGLVVASTRAATSWGARAKHDRR